MSPPCTRRTFLTATLAGALACATRVRDVRAHEPDAEEVALGSLIDAELAFARLAGERGVRFAFLASFAPDGVAFEPAPVRLQEAWAARPAPADPLAVSLRWQPAQAGVARSLDLGYTTGPYTLADSARPGHAEDGVFFSVWRRDGGGPWRVALDAGIATPEAVDFALLGAAPRPRYAGAADAKAAERALRLREARSLVVDPSRSSGDAYAGTLAQDARLYRDGAAPIAGRRAVAREYAKRVRRVEWTPIETRVSAAADLAVSYGRQVETERGGRTRGAYYAHLWLRDAAGRWRLAYDLAKPAAR
jgi:ketosteroid isomerase-like protein